MSKKVSVRWQCKGCGEHQRWKWSQEDATDAINGYTFCACEFCAREYEVYFTVDWEKCRLVGEIG